MTCAQNLPERAAERRRLGISAEVLSVYPGDGHMACGFISIKVKSGYRYSSSHWPGAWGDTILISYTAGYRYLWRTNWSNRRNVTVSAQISAFRWMFGNGYSVRDPISRRNSSQGVGCGIFGFHESYSPEVNLRVHWSGIHGSTDWDHRRRSNRRLYRRDAYQSWTRCHNRRSVAGACGCSEGERPHHSSQ